MKEVRRLTKRPQVCGNYFYQVLLTCIDLEDRDNSLAPFTLTPLVRPQRNGTRTEE